ncbi:dopamine receptor 2-like [Physella acuta]|uniref:dopamine receptor 2-like n=1 Tax=Physella acuta TaxID=109671 RepID=UPI0027DBF3AD|nr:dopamine receptor 2-like [Physella acuta]
MKNSSANSTEVFSLENDADLTSNVFKVSVSDHDLSFSTVSTIILWNNSLSNTSYQLSNPAIAFLLVAFSLVVVIGNLMVIFAVYREVYLRTVTNYFIVSLAIADVMVGGVVMPFSISNELTRSVWLYGQAWCDMWRSLDVLASTASILNLCVISLDRYWAITDPIAYPSKMSNGKVCILIALVWFCSAGISFPAIAWWRAVTPTDLPKNQCLFTEDSAYLIISSVVSFYVPTFIMMFVYCKIYKAAQAQTEGIKSGCKITADCPKGDNGEVMTLRIHRGGYRLGNDLDQATNMFNHRNSDIDSELSLSTHHQAYINKNMNQQGRPATFISKKIKHFAISKKLTKIAKEQKAAKTLGIVVGVFVICWVPFFCANVLFGLCHSECIYRPEILFPVFTWLGYINSGMNPIIYALSMKDFRRAFSKMILCCPRYRHSQNKRYTYSHSNSLSTSSFSVNYNEKCVHLKI